jgi:hypothetical protein
MRGLGGARAVCRLELRAAFGAVGRFPDDEQLSVVKREPSLPLGIGNAGSTLQRLAERRQLVRQIREFRPQFAQRSLRRIRAGDVADEMHHGVAIRDIDIELVERVAAKVLEVLLHLHFDIVPREVGAQLFAISAELIRNGREKNLHRHESGSGFGNLTGNAGGCGDTGSPGRPSGASR